MYITSEQIQDFEEDYGSPPVLKTAFKMNPREFQGLLKSQKFGRNHDITFFILKEDRWIVIAKHWYPKGLYRIPSGGAKPGESLKDGCEREALEETGCKIDLLRYFLRIDVEFSYGSEKVDWITHLVLARWLSGHLIPIDIREIREVQLARREDFDDFGRIMLASDSGGLHYREFLHRQAFAILDDLTA